MGIRPSIIWTHFANIHSHKNMSPQSLRGRGTFLQPDMHGSCQVQGPVLNGSICVDFDREASPPVACSVCCATVQCRDRFGDLRVERVLRSSSNMALDWRRLYTLQSHQPNLSRLGLTPASPSSPSQQSCQAKRQGLLQDHPEGSLVVKRGFELKSP